MPHLKIVATHTRPYWIEVDEWQDKAVYKIAFQSVPKAAVTIRSLLIFRSFHRTRTTSQC